MELNLKSGIINIAIPIGIIVIIIILLVVFFTYYQINILASGVKSDLSYICQNVILSFNTIDLTYNKYTINKEKSAEIIQEILNKNYKDNAKIKNIEIIELKYFENENNDCTNGRKSILHIIVEIKFETIIKISSSKINSFRIHEDISLSLLNYGGVNE